jgi:hypothetical protein
VNAAHDREESEVLNHRREDHPISASTVTSMPRRICQAFGRAAADFVYATEW